MKTRFLNEESFKNGFRDMMNLSLDVFDGIIRERFKDYSLHRFSFSYVSDQRGKVEALSAFLSENYNYNAGTISKRDRKWELNAISNDFPVDMDMLIYWAIDMYNKGFEFDCKFIEFKKLEMPDPALPDFSRQKCSYYSELAAKEFENRNFSGAIINWSLVLKINPGDISSFYSREIARNQLYSTGFKSAALS
jgi:hypothetical protein